MSLRLEMLQVARLACNPLGDSAGLVKKFILSQLNPDGGFKGRTGESDLYYTVFGLECLLALQAEDSCRIQITSEYLGQFGDGSDLDFVHLTCLARCWADLPESCQMPESDREGLLDKLETYRALDGGFHHLTPNSPHSSAYGSFLALGAYQDLFEEPSDSLRWIQSFKHLEMTDGGWANERKMDQSATPATAAAVTALRQLGQPLNDEAVADWILKMYHPQGGFRAAPRSPVPDLLSTAVALHALSGLEVDCDRLKESCLDFIDTLWVNEGSFYGHWQEDVLDTEYTFYGLLALGHLSVME